MRNSTNEVINMPSDMIAPDTLYFTNPYVAYIP